MSLYSHKSTSPLDGFLKFDLVFLMFLFHNSPRLLLSAPLKDTNYSLTCCELYKSIKKKIIIIERE